MSRTGKRPVPIPSGVSVAVDGDTVRVKGPKGELSHFVLAGTAVAIEGNEARVSSERRRSWNVRWHHGSIGLCS